MGEACRRACERRARQPGRGGGVPAARSRRGRLVSALACSNIGAASSPSCNRCRASSRRCSSRGAARRSRSSASALACASTPGWKRAWSSLRAVAGEESFSPRPSSRRAGLLCRRSARRRSAGGPRSAAPFRSVARSDNNSSSRGCLRASRASRGPSARRPSISPRPSRRAPLGPQARCSRPCPPRWRGFRAKPAFRCCARSRERRPTRRPLSAWRRFSKRSCGRFRPLRKRVSSNALRECAERFPLCVVPLLRSLPRAIDHAGPRGLARWIERGEEIAETNLEAGRAYFALESRTALRYLRENSAAVHMEEVHGVLRSYARMLSAASLTLRSGDGVSLRPFLDRESLERSSIALPRVRRFLPLVGRKLLRPQACDRGRRGTPASTAASISPWSECEPGSRRRSRPCSRR